MSAPRTRYARNAKAKATAALKEESDSESEVHQISESESEAQSEDDPQPKRKKIVAAPPLKTSDVPLKPGRGNRGKLSQLPSMPLDILFNIFSLLHPKDLMSLARVTKLFRETLLAPNAATIWINSRKDYGYDCPAPGEGLSETYWAWMIWDSKCGVCVTTGVPGLYFELRKRICKACLTNDSIRRNRFAKLYPHYSADVLNLIPSLSQNRFWIKDIIEHGDKLVKLERAAQKGKPDPKAALEAYKRERQRFVKGVEEHAKICHDWHTKMTQEKAQDGSNTSKQRRNEIKRRFRALGYADEDIEPATRWSSGATRETELTERGWALVRPSLEGKIMATKARRMNSNHKTIISARKSLLAALYKTFKSQYTPDEWVYFPTLELVQDLSIFNPIIYAHESTQIEEGAFTEAMELLPNALKAYDDQRRKLLLSRCLESQRPHYQAFQPKDKKAKTKVTVKPFELAISVFVLSYSRWTFPHAQKLFGLSGVKLHSPTLDSPGIYLHPRVSENPFLDLHLNGVVSTRVATLVESLDLEPAKVSTEEMDGMDRRWVCVSVACGGPLDKSSAKPRTVYDWKTAAVHEHEYNYLTHGTEVELLLLSPEATKRVKEEEETSRSASDGIYERPNWSCRHCNEHLENLKPRSVVMSHVASEHAIPNPTEQDILMCNEQEHFSIRGYSAARLSVEGEVET